MNIIESRKYVGTSLQDHDKIRRQIQMPLVTYCDADNDDAINGAGLAGSRHHQEYKPAGLERQVTEIDFETNLEYETIALQWRLLELDKLIQKALVDKAHRVLTSPTFQDSSGRSWWVRLRLCQDDPDIIKGRPINTSCGRSVCNHTAQMLSSDGMSLYLYSKKTTSSFPTRFQFVLSFLDKDKKNIDGIEGHCSDVTFHQPTSSDETVDNWGAENIVDANALARLAEMSEIYLKLNLNIWLAPKTNLILAREVR